MSDDVRDDEISGALARSVASLREEPPVRAAWRADLLERIEREGRTSARWSMRPWFAIAAGIGLLLIGGLAGQLVKRPTSPGTVATSRTIPGPATVRFVYVAPGAAKVSVVGDFNQWNPTAIPLRRLGDGTWIADVPLAPGQYAYAFVVDGKIEVDPSAPRARSDFGENSILMVRGT
jgi:hypothetical protein